MGVVLSGTPEIPNPLAAEAARQSVDIHSLGATPYRGKYLVMVEATAPPIAPESSPED